MTQSRRTQIIKALEDLCEWKHANEFQMISFHLLRKRYPDLVSTKLIHDEGQDAITVPSIGSDGVKRSMACSLTGTIKKIREDCRRIKECDEIDCLIFCTPTDLSKKQITPLEEKIKNEFGYELIIFPRQAIIAELERPENEWICKEFLKVDFSSCPDIYKAKDELRNTILDSFEGWKQEYDYDSTHLIELKFKRKEKDKESELLIDDIINITLQSGKIILKGAPGSGKSITLLQITEKLLNNIENPIPVLISIPMWASTSFKIIDFLSNSFSITALNLIALLKASQIVLILNGWNEVPTNEINKINEYLKDFIRNYPSVSMIITSRESKCNPSIPNPCIIYIGSLTAEQRNQIIRRKAPLEYEFIKSIIDNNFSLNDITRTPLFLIGFIKTYQINKEVPETRYDIINEFIISAELERNPFLADNQHIGDPLWTCNYLIKKMYQGEFWEEQWTKYLSYTSNESFEKLISLVLKKDIQRNEFQDRIKILVEISAEKTSQELFRYYINIEDSNNQEKSFFVLDAIKDIPLNIRVETVINEYDSLDSYNSIKKILETLISFPSIGLNYRDILTKEQIRKLIGLILKWEDKLSISINDNGYCKANLAYLLGHVCGSEEVKILVKWIEDEKQRVKTRNETYEAQLREYKEKGGEIPKRYCECHSSYYVGALAAFGSEEVTQIFLEFLDDPEYISYASSYLLKKELERHKYYSVDTSYMRKNYGLIFEKRREKNKIVFSCNSYVCIIRSKLNHILDKYEFEGKQPPYLYNLSKVLVSLAYVDSQELFPIIFRMASYKSTIWDVSEALRILAFRGYIVSGEQIFKIADPVITKIENSWNYYDDNQWYLAINFLFLLLFSDSPNIGIKRIKMVPQKCLTDERLRRLIEIVGFSKSSDAIEYLSEQSNNSKVLQYCFQEYMLALSINNCKKTQETIINILYSANENSEFNSFIKKEPHKYINILAETIIGIIGQDSDFGEEVKKYCFSASKEIERIIALSILKNIGTEETAIIACNLLNDESNCGLQYYFEELFKKVSTDRVEADSPNTYHIVPKPCSTLRAHLINLVLNDKKRKNSALLLLSYIETIRIEYGNPIDEPRNPGIDFNNLAADDIIPWVLL